MATFYEWAKRKRIMDNPKGDFLFDLQRDKTAGEVANTKEAWDRHLSVVGACWEAKDIFDQLWKDYQKSPSCDKPVGVGYVYFVRYGLEDVFKIGMTMQNLAGRLSGIQTGSPTPLTLHGYIETDQPSALEEKLHKRYAKYRISGEWFRIPTSTIDKLLDSQ